MVEVEHEGVSTFDQCVGGVLVLLQELELVDDVGLQEVAVFLEIVSDVVVRWMNKTRVCSFLLSRHGDFSSFLDGILKRNAGFHAYLEPRNLLLDIVCQISEPCAV